MSVATRVREATLTHLREAIPWPDIYPFGILGFFVFAIPWLLFRIHLPREPGSSAVAFGFIGGILGAFVIAGGKSRRERARESTQEREARARRPSGKGVWIKLLPIIPLVFAPPFFWWANAPEAHDGSVEVDGDELGSWTLEPELLDWLRGTSLECDYPTTWSGGSAYDSVFVTQKGHGIWVGPDGVTIEITADAGKTPRTAYVSRESCSKYETRLEPFRAWFGKFGDEHSESSATGEVHLSCELPSGGTLEADLDLGSCKPDRSAQRPETPDEPEVPMTSHER